jgi:hypothetical protein
MIVAAVLLLLQSAAAVPSAAGPSSDAEEIVVLARKFEALQMKVSASRNGELRSCKVRVPSDDPLLNSNACDAVRICVARLVPEGASKADLNDCIIAELQSRKAASVSPGTAQ